MNKPDESDEFHKKSPKQSYWATHIGLALFSCSLIGLGILLLVIGIPGEERLRPYYVCYNCEESWDPEFPTSCDYCEPEEYAIYGALIFLGLVSLVIGIFILAGVGREKKSPPALDVEADA